MDASDYNRLRTSDRSLAVIEIGECTLVLTKLFEAEETKIDEQQIYVQTVSEQNYRQTISSRKK